MKKLTLYLLTTLALIYSGSIAAQTFEYTENKGQWENEVLYKGELSNGAFFLKRNGYRVVQHSPNDFARIKATVTAHEHYDAPKGATLGANMAGSNDQSLDNGGEKGGGGNFEKELVLKSHAYDVSFEGANPKSTIQTQKQMPGAFNYLLGNNPDKWAGDVHAFGEVWMKQLYPGIDIRYYSDRGFLKFDLVVQPNAVSEKIIMKYTGAEGLSVRDGALVIKTSVNEVIEQSPYTYQLINGQRKQVGCKYEVIGNLVRFKLSAYDRTQTLIIDPTLIFSSFTGSSADNWGYTATYDAGGNLYAGGIAFSSGYPVTAGAFQTTFRGGSNTGEGSGGFDMAIMKFNPVGSARIYATYIGGTGNEQPHSLVVDNAGNLVIAGRTTSTDYPTTTPRIGPGGAWDIVVSKLNATGSTMLGSIRIGGSADDGVNIKHKYSGGGAFPISLQQNYGDDARSEVILDPAGNILVASCTRSNNFPVSAGAFQSTLRGDQDALVLKFNSTLSTVLFATYLGGLSDDAAYVLAMSPAGNIYVGGGTRSADFPGDRLGVVGASFNGGEADGFLAELNPTGTAVLKFSFFGTPGIDQVYGVQFDRNGFVYIMGQTTGNFPVTNAPFSQPGGKQFIAKLQNDFSGYIYSMVFGTNSPSPNISPIAFLVDRCENVYVSGWGGRVLADAQGVPGFPTSGTNGLTITPDAIQSQTDGKDFYFFVLEKDATRQLFGSFFGQQTGVGAGGADHVDGGTSRFDVSGTIYQGICANCGGGQFPITPGVVGPSNPSGRCNQAVLKIALDLSGVRSGVKSSIRAVDGDTMACVPTTVNFRDTIGLARSYEWDFGDGTNAITTVPNINHTYNAVGLYRVRMIAVDSSKCYMRDTTYVRIRVRDDFANVLASATKLLPCESNTYQFTNLSTPANGKPFSNTSFTWFFGDNSTPVIGGTAPVTHQYPGAGTYNVRLLLTDTNYCNAPDSFVIQLRVSPLVDANFTTPPSGCAPYDAVFTNTSMGGQQFFWSFGDGTTSTSINPVKNYAVPGTYTVKLIAVDSSTCNIIDSTTQTIVVSGKPTVNFSYSPNPPEENIITSFTNSSDIVPRYKWLFGDGDSLLTFRRDTTVKHQYRQTGTYTACLIGINQFGCPDTLCQPIQAIVAPLIDVVSAFTPNGDGVNDKAVVFGYGVSKMTFRIYNRWGQLVFETADVRQGWDGKFKGKPQAMDAYGFTLDAELISGDKVKRSGSITLIR
ncbi:MAG TPA: PKD domain-containing protein [Phnomibacter sp.]|nr:PKD domain-containing protein [Phnomibacter sp.]